MLRDSDSLKIMLLVGVVSGFYVRGMFHGAAIYRRRNTRFRLTNGLSQGVCQRRLSRAVRGRRMEKQMVTKRDGDENECGAGVTGLGGLGVGKLD